MRSSQTLQLSLQWSAEKKYQRHQGCPDPAGGVPWPFPHFATLLRKARAVFHCTFLIIYYIVLKWAYPVIY
jgi:hypothetical protein